MRRSSSHFAPLAAWQRVAYLGVVLALSAWAAQPVAAQSLNDLGSALVPADSAEPKVTVRLAPTAGRSADDDVTLTIKLDIPADAYVYSQTDKIGPTKITVTELYGLEPVTGSFTPDHPPKIVFEEVFEENVEKFPGGVTWTRRFRVTGQVPPDQVSLMGTIQFQVCDARNCRRFDEEFDVLLELDGTVSARAVGVADAPPMATEADHVAEPATDIAGVSENNDSATQQPPSIRAAETPGQPADVSLEFNLASQANEATLPWYLGMAFLGGLILNIMPCVLPVLAIKVMSFVQQAGESRGRVLALNISYSLGVIAVFLVLASLAVTLKMGWGGQFQSEEFNLAMIALVFAMGLSLLGVFEIPIPGMIGSSGGQHREGLLGAFFIGIFATLLATPCSGPFMTTALAWSVKQEPNIVYLVWGVMGLGMASPFLAVGLVPAVARFIPRPGDWMVRFKEFCGFAMMAAVIWLMNSLVSEVIWPTLIMLFGLGLGLWMVGSMYDHTSTFTRKVSVRFYALLTTGLICWYGFGEYENGRAVAEARLNGPDAATVAREGELPWEPFSGERLLGLLREGKPVLIDFTANWCAICKQNELIALNTEATIDFVQKHGVVTLYADYTSYDKEIEEWLARFGATAIPLTVVFKAGDPQNPIIIDGPYTQSTLLNTLEEAVTSNVAVETQQSAFIDHSSR